MLVEGKCKARGASSTSSHLLFFFLPVLLFRFLGASDSNQAMMKLLWVVMLVVGTAFADDEDKKDSVGTVVGIDLGTTYSW